MSDVSKITINLDKSMKKESKKITIDENTSIRFNFKESVKFYRLF